MSYTIPGQDGIVNTDPPSTPCTGDFFDKLHCEEHGWFLWVAAFCFLVVICGLCSCYVVTPISQALEDKFGIDEDDNNPKAGAAATRDEEAVNANGGSLAFREQKKPIGSKSRHHERYHHWYLNDILKITPEDVMELGSIHHAPTNTVTTPSSSTTTRSWAPQPRNLHQKYHNRRSSSSSNNNNNNNKSQNVLDTSEKRRRRRGSSMSSNGSLLGVSTLLSSSVTSGSDSKEGDVNSNVSKRERKKETINKNDSNNNTREEAVAQTNHHHHHHHRHRHDRHRATTARTTTTGRRAVVVDDPGIGAEATRRGGGWMGAANGRL
ncbi:unnamed protein product [Pylaiella littoralis]